MGFFTFYFIYYAHLNIFCMLNTVCFCIYIFCFSYSCCVNPFTVVLLPLCYSYINHNVYSPANGGIKCLHTYMIYDHNIYCLCFVLGIGMLAEWSKVLIAVPWPLMV